MKTPSLRRTCLALWTAALVTPAVGCQTVSANPALSPEQQARLNRLQEHSTNASLTVFPVVVGDRPMIEAAEVLALLLEQAGMKNLEIADAVFQMPAEASADDTAEHFGNFVRNADLKTDYALYAVFDGDRKTWPESIRGVIVDRTGQPVLDDLQTADDRAFKRAKPDEPMTCCVFLAERVQKQLRIPKSARDDSGEGKIAEMLTAKSPGPDKAEWKAMEERQAVMKKACKKATVTVFPVRLADDKVSSEDAMHLVKLFKDQKLCDASVASTPLQVAIKPSHNEQDVLWELARKFRDHVRQYPPDTDYALMADYLIGGRGNRVRGTHFVVCDRDGQWVIVDYQNSHHGDFQSIDPKTHDDCGRLVARRLKGYLR